MKVLHSKGVNNGGRRVLLAVPSYGGISAETLYSLFGSKECLLNNNIESELLIFDGNCHVDDGRNRLVRDFLETDCSQFIFIDTDVRFDPEDLVRLVLHNQDVVAGIYPLKQETEDYPVRFIDGEIWAGNDGLIEVESVPTGFLKIKRNVLEKLYDTVPKFKTKQDNPNQKKVPLIFERTMEGETRWGGDYEFCRKWRKLGGKIFIDPEMSFGHVGSYEWSGSLGHHLRKKNGLTDKFIKSILNKISKGMETESDIFKLWEAWGNPWSARPDFLMTMIMLARENKGRILECGSGLTTMILSALKCKTTVLEHDSEWAQKINNKMDSMCLNSVDIRYAPIVEVKHSPIKNKWYEFNEKDSYSMAIIDGPPREIGRDGFLNIKNQLEKGCVILADDAGDMQNWEKELNVKFNILGDGRKYAIAKTEGS